MKPKFFITGRKSPFVLCYGFRGSNIEVAHLTKVHKADAQTLAADLNSHPKSSLKQWLDDTNND